MATEVPPALLISEYYRLARRRELKRSTDIELSTWDQAEAVFAQKEDAMCFCGATDCRTCGPLQGYHPCEHNHMPDHCPYRDCENCADYEPPILCVECDDPGPIRSYECGESFCQQCFDKHWRDEHEAEAA
jgi:hypothetical protein